MHRITRRSALSFAAAAALPTARARAQEGWPSQPVRIIVGYAPGGNTDIPARLFAAAMARSLGQPVVVENRPGASGVPAAQMVSRARADGHTLVWATSASHSVAVVAVAPLPYDPVRDFTPITLISADPNVILGGPGFAPNGLPALLDYLRAHPGTPVGNSGPATSGRFATELMRPTLGLEITPVPYSSTGPLLTDLVSGTIPLAIMGASTAQPFLREGRIRPFAVTSMTRSPIMPEVPTFDETVAPGFEAVAWSALLAPPGLPGPVASRINAAMREAAQQPEVKGWLASSGLQVPLGTGEELRRFIQADIARWVEVARVNKLVFTSGG